MRIKYGHQLVLMLILARYRVDNLSVELHLPFPSTVEIKAQYLFLKTLENKGYWFCFVLNCVLSS